MQQLRVIAIIAWLLLRQPSETGATGGQEDLTAALTADNTMEATRYDLSDRADELNVILISLDALRYDHTGYGGGTRNTPYLDQLAEESVVFSDAVSAAPWTLPSHMAVWTGRWPSIHGVTNKLEPLAGGGWADASLSPGIETYPDMLARAGYKTAAFTGGAGVSGRFGFNKGFETYLDDRKFAGLDYSMPAALKWLEENRGERFFLFLHGYDTHGQYPLPGPELESIPYDGRLDGSVEEQAELREQGLETITEPGMSPDLTGELSSKDADFLKAVYALKVRDADQRVGTFISKLKSMGLYENTVIMVMSDHGDEFLEHGGLDHGISLYQEQIHVVMMIRFPGYGRRQDISETVRTIDLFPTVFDALGQQGPAGVDGVSLLPLLRGQSWDAGIFSETDYRLFVNHRMVRDGQYKLILDLQDGKKELYDLTADPGEQHDISSSEQRRTYEMEQGLRSWMSTTKVNPQDFLGLRQDKIEIF
jgi:choline-sulfatase